MVLTTSDLEKLQLFTNVNLNRSQVETILGKQLKRAEWKSVRHQFPNFSNPIITKKKHKHTKQKIVRTQEEIKQLRNHVSSSSEQQQQPLQDDDFRLRNLFRHTNDSTYHVIKVFDEYIPKFKSRRTHWKILGDSNIFNIRNAITDLVNDMTNGLPDNVYIQVQLSTPDHDHQPVTRLISKQDMIDSLFDWVNLFIEYKDYDIEDVVFKLLLIHIPAGAGGRRNAIVDPERSKAMMHLSNTDTQCLVKSIILYLGKNNKNKLGDIFKNKLTDAEVAEINYKRKDKTGINNGIFTDNEITYLRQPTKRLLPVIS
jgi:hypothetical protein